MEEYSALKPLICTKRWKLVGLTSTSTLRGYSRDTPFYLQLLGCLLKCKISGSIPDPIVRDTWLEIWTHFCYSIHSLRMLCIYSVYFDHVCAVPLPRQEQHEFRGVSQSLLDWIWSLLHRRELIPDTVTQALNPWFGRSEALVKNLLLSHC